MRRYFRIFLGQGSKHAALGIQEGWVGTSWLADIDLSDRFPDNLKDFNQQFIDEVMARDGVTSRVGAGLACGMTWTLGRGMSEGDVVICSDQGGLFHIGTIAAQYRYVKGGPLPHRRAVNWLNVNFRREDVSEEFRRTLTSGNVVSNIDHHRNELERLISGEPGAVFVNDDRVENPLSFVLERHLEDFLVSNWAHTDLGKHLDIFQQDGETVGRQFQTDTGEIDILAQSKDGKELVVIELKRGRVSDVVVGQILRYMSYVKDLDDSKSVRGIIIGTEDDIRFRRALAMVPNIEFLRYEVSFSLKKVDR